MPLLLFFPKTTNKITGTRGERGVRNADRVKQREMGEFGGQCGHKYNDGGVASKIFKRSTTVFKSSSRGNNVRRDYHSVRRLCSYLAEIKGCKRNYDLPTSSFFETFHASKEKREKSSNHRPFKIKSLIRNSLIQNGNHFNNFKIHCKRPLGLFNRHQGCLLSRSNKLGLSQISSIQMERQNFCISIPPLRSLSCSLGFHKGNFPNQEKTSLTNDTNFQLFGRFYPVCKKSRRSIRSSKYGIRITPESRIHNKLGEIEYPHRDNSNVQPHETSTR